jgi:hypothetical protein
MQLAMPDFKYQIMAKAALYVSGKGHRNVAYWHIALIRCAAKFGRYWGIADIEQMPLTNLDLFSLAHLAHLTATKTAFHVVK